MGKWHAHGTAHFSMPQAVLGLAGIYDLVALRDHYMTIPVYQEIIETAFGEEDKWNQASPAAANIRDSWINARLAVLAYSVSDELVPQDQLDRMAAMLKGLGCSNRKDLVLSLKGKHDEIWRDGWELAQSIVTTLQHLLHASTRRQSHASSSTT